MRRARRRTPKHRENPETPIQAAAVELLERLQEIAWVRRINTGAGMLGYRDKKTGAVKHSRFMKFGFKGCADIVGQLGVRYGGRFFACEVKVRGEEPTEDQQAFLDGVNAAGGVGIWIDDIQQIIPKLRARLAELRTPVEPARASGGAAHTSLDAVGTTGCKASVEAPVPAVGSVP